MLLAALMMEAAVATGFMAVAVRPGREATNTARPAHPPAPEPPERNKHKANL